MGNETFLQKKKLLEMLEKPFRVPLVSPPLPPQLFIRYVYILPKKVETATVGTNTEDMADMAVKKAPIIESSASTTKQYKIVSTAQREQFIKLVAEKGLKIKSAANIVGIGYENAKLIIKIYKREGRTHKLCFKNVPKPRK